MQIDQVNNASQPAQPLQGQQIQPPVQEQLAFGSSVTQAVPTQNQLGGPTLVQQQPAANLSQPGQQPANQFTMGQSSLSQTAPPGGVQQSFVGSQQSASKTRAAPVTTAPAQPNSVSKQLFEKVKKGDVEEVVQMVREYGLDLTTLLDEPKNFSQTPIFSACVVKGEENSLKMVQVLIDLGCDPNKEDDLKQIPLFYASREGYNKVVNLLISHGADVNRSDPQHRNCESFISLSQLQLQKDQMTQSGSEGDSKFK